MTSRERAVLVATQFNNNDPGVFPNRAALETLVRRAVELTVREERQRCRAAARALLAEYSAERDNGAGMLVALSAAKAAAVERVIEAIGADDKPTGPW